MRSYVLFSALILLASCAQKQKGAGYAGHGAESLPPQTIAKFAPKPLPEERLARIQSLLDVRTPSKGVLSPDGRALFVNWSVTGTSQIWKVPGAKRFPVQMTGGEDRASLQGVTPDGKFLIVTRDQKGDEYPGLYLQRADGGPLIEVFRQAKVQAFPEFVTDDSRYLYYRANDRDPMSYAFYKYDIGNKTREMIFEGPAGYWVIADHWRDGTLLVANWKGNTASEYYLYHEKEKKLVPLFGQDEQQEYVVQFGRAKDDLVVLTNKFDEFRRLYRYKSGKFTPLTPQANYDISGFSVDLPRTKILYSLNKQGYFTIGAMDLGGFRPLELPRFADPKVLHVTFGSTTRDGRYTTMGVERSDEPETSYVYDWRTKKLVQWVLPSGPEIDTKNFSVPTLEHYVARDGTKIPMFVNRPDACRDKVCPVVVNFHGGPEAQANPWFSPLMELYMEEGFIYVKPNVRGSDGYGKTWLHSDNGAKRLDVIGDIEDASIYIKKHWAKNGQTPKVAIMGGSYGGYSAFVGMTLFAGAYDAGIAVVGMSSLVSFLQNTAPYRRALRVSEYGDLEKDREALEKLSPINYLDKIKDPILIIHGATDPRVPAGEAVQIYEVMEKKGLPGELILFPDEGHGVAKRRNQAVYFGHTLEFLKKHLK